MAQVQFIFTSPQELQQQINRRKIQLNFKTLHKTTKEYLPSEVATMFSVDISNVHNW
jgi:hypothetical protein